MISDDKNKINILENNLSNILNIIDISNIKKNETSYLYKNISKNKFEILT
jgi:hypothetical protein